MRKDMAKVIVERPRTGGDGGKSIPRKGYKKRLAKTPLDELPKRESTARHRQYSDYKRLNEHLNPLKKYLEKQVGRHWDLVWSEICSNLRITSAVQSHVRDHVDDFVKKNVVMLADGKVAYLNKWGRLSGSPWIELHNGDLFVHPESGILSKYKAAPPPQKRKRPITRLKIDSKREYRLVKGVWFELEFDAIPNIGGITPIFFDRLMNCYPTVQECVRTYRGKIYCRHKRQLNKTEIKKLGLRKMVA